MQLADRLATRGYDYLQVTSVVRSRIRLAADSTLDYASQMLLEELMLNS